MLPSVQVDELIAIYQPFKATPADYEGCRGSTPIYRGYPCSLWQLFHSMMVNAAIKGIVIQSIEILGT